MNTSLTGLGLVIALSLAGCDYLPFGFTPIGQIAEQAASYEGREVKLRGKVVDVNKIPILDIVTYTLCDDTGVIVVTHPTKLPGIGEEIALHGRVENLLILAGEGMGTTIREIGRLPVIPDLKP